MEKIIIQNQKGFTLIELLLYLGMSAIMVALLGGIGVNVLSSLASAKAQEELQYNAQFVTERIRSVIHESSAIESPLAGSTSTTLTLAMIDPVKNPTTIELVDGKVLIQQGTEDSQILSGSNVVVNSIEFSNLTHEGTAGTLRFAIDIGLYNPENSTAFRANAVFYTTVNLNYP